MFERQRRELDEEIEAHLRLAQQDGHTAESARRLFGNVTLVKEQAREIWGWIWLESILQDIRYAARTLRRSPGFTLTAILVLTIGIGANTAMFSLISTLLLRPLNVPDPDRVVVFSNAKADENDAASPAKFNVWRGQKQLFNEVSAWEGASAVNLAGVDAPEQVREMKATAGYFHLFGVSFSQGRGFNDDEDLPFGGHFVVLSHDFWETRFHSDPNIAGKTLVLGGVPHRITGVLAASYRPFTFPAPEVYVPMQIDPNSNDQGDSMLVAGRLKPGVTIEAARIKMKAVGEEFRRQHPGALDPDEGFGAKRLREELYGAVAPSLILFQCIVGFVLLIACANIANLLLVRASTREREISIRAALGAAKGRIVRQLLTESGMLACAGSITGLIAGIAGMRALVNSNPFVLQWLEGYAPGIAIDWPVVIFTIALALMTGVLFGIVPALQISRLGRGSVRTKMRSLLTVGEVALALVLLIGAGLLIRSLAALQKVQPGFDSHNVVVMQMSLAGVRFGNVDALAELSRESVRRLEATPGVSAAMAACLPIDCTLDLPVIIGGRPLAGASHGDVYWNAVSPGYFDTLRIPLLRGRGFSDGDSGRSASVAVINQAMARKYWPNGNPIGARLTLGRGMGPQYTDQPRQIIGIVGDIRSEGLDQPPNPAVYIPAAQIAPSFYAKLFQSIPFTWIVRTRAAQTSAIVPIENALHASSGLPVGKVRMMDDLVARSISSYEFTGLLLTIFSGVALALAAIGIYGVMAYSVRQRTREIGIRLALGAEAHTVRNRVVIEAMRLATAGTAIGLGSAVGLSRLLSSELYGVRPLDPAAFMLGAVLLFVAALAAAWLPARRASRVNPMDAIRHE